MKVAVKVLPNASRDEVVGWLGQELKVRVQAPPEAGKANKRLCRLLAQFCGLPEGAVAVVSGQSNARKIIELNGIEGDRLKALVDGV